MTRTISNKTSAKQGTAIFFDQLKKLRTPMIVFGIIAVFFITVIFSLSMVAVNSVNNNSYPFDSTDVSAMLFCPISSAVVFLLTAIFALIYALRATSYLHNKRKADMIFPMPVKSGVMFMSKSLAAFAAAVIPALFLIGIICILSLCLGAPVDKQIIELFWTIPLGSAACIAFFGVMAICCGTTANTVLTFLAICFAYPISMFFIRETIDAFFIGMPLNFGNDFFLFKALNPFAAYDGLNVIYWLLFIIGCAALSLLLLKNRKSERAQTTYAYRLPCYIVELLITFIVGMLTGTIFGMLKVLIIPFAGFVFGFILGGSAAFVICHVILFHGFRRILKSLIFYGAATAAVISFVAVCVYASPMFTGYVPNMDEIESAGYVELTSDYAVSFNHSTANFIDVNEAIPQSSGDFTDKIQIEYIVAEHENTVKYVKKLPDSFKFSKILISPMYDAVHEIAGYDNSFGMSYKLKDGRTVSRYYTQMDISYIPIDGDDGYYTKTDYIEALVKSEAYQNKYNPLCAVPFEDITDLEVDVFDSNFTIGENGDAKKIYTALQQDFKEHGYDNSDFMYSEYSVSYNYKNKTERRGIFSLLGNDFYDDGYYSIPMSYRRTLQAMRDAGIIDDKNNAVKKSPYYTGNRWDEEEYLGGESDTDIPYYEGESLPLNICEVTAPFDCNGRVNYGLYSYTDTKDSESVLIFEAVDSYAPDYAEIFEVISYDKQGVTKSVDFEYGTAKVKADGKEETLHYLRSADYEDGSPAVFFTEKVTDSQFKSMVNSVELFENEGFVESV